MSRRAKWIWGIAGIVAAALFAWIATHMLGLADMGGSDSELSVDLTDADEEPSAVLCSSQATADAVGARVFARAREASQDPEALARLEADSLVRLDRTELTEYIEARDVAECSARLVIELPRGTEPAFGYSRRLRADIDYVVRGGSGAIDRLSGADLVITDLAAADLSIRERAFEDTSDEEDPIGALIEDIEGEPDDRPDQPAQRPRPGPPAEGDPVDLLPPEMDGQGR
ncbi:MAG: hypothetical protein ABR601_06290 [Parasphingopyxis sp.]|nr:hypothetical protein [Sphingomonadales bacterium]